MSVLGFISSALGDAVGSIPVVGGALQGGLNYLAKRKDAKEDAQTQQDYNLEAMGAQHTYNMEAQHDSQSFNERMQEDAQTFNAEQAQMARDFNAEEAQKARDWELEMFNRENEYNSPAAQMQRLIDAGINPMEFNTPANSGASANPAAVASAGSPASISAVQSGISNTGVLAGPSLRNVDPVQDALLRSQIKNTEEDTNTKRINNEFLPELLSGQIKQQNATYNYTVEQTKCSTKTAQEIEQRTKLCSEQVQNVRTATDKLVNDIKLSQAYKSLADAQAANVRQDTVIKHIQEAFESDRCQAVINDLIASAGLKGAQAQQARAVAELTFYQSLNESLRSEGIAIDNLQRAQNLGEQQATAGIRILSMFNQNRVSWLQGVQLDWQNQQAAWTLGQHKKWDDVNQTLHAIDVGTTAAARISSELRGWMNPLSGSSNNNIYTMPANSSTSLSW